MILSDSRILAEIELGTIIIKPFDKTCLGTNSYDVHLSKYLATYEDVILDAKNHNKLHHLEIPDEGFVLEPGKLYLGSTLEYTETQKHVPFLDGKSSTGRMGISIHATAGKGDVGFCGNWTLEISTNHKVRIYAGMPIGQIFYHTVEGEVLNPYDKKGSQKYAGQGEKPVESMMWKNFIDTKIHP